MRTLVFCTCYLADEAAWRGRYRAWLDHVSALSIARDGVFLIDDASPWIPADADVAVVPAGALPPALDGRPVLCRFDTHLGRQDLVVFPGWLRSFLYSLVVARHYGFERIVHLESDARLLSRRMMAHVDSRRSGWTAYWTALQGFPETAIQVICVDAFDAMERFAADPQSEIDGMIIELALPYTDIETGFIGDRYGEKGLSPPDHADYACQFDWREPVRFHDGSGAPSVAEPPGAGPERPARPSLFARWKARLR